MIKRTFFWLLIAFPLFFYSCEYELDDTNYVEVEKPGNLSYKIDLKAPVNEKGEYIVKYDYLKYATDLPEDGYSRDIYLISGNYNYHLYDEKNYINIPWVEGKYVLKYTISKSSGNGSLASETGYENLTQTFEWDVLVQKERPVLNPQYIFVDYDGTFELTWDTIDPNYGEIDYYKVSSYWGEFSKIVYEPSCIIKLPEYGGTYEYIVEAYFKESFISSLSESVYVFKPVPTNN